MRTYTKETQDKLSPELALEILKEGNERFMNNIKAHRNLLTQINETATGQFPFAAILSCIDSRTSAELIFDQGLGDIFSIRIAGNILNDDILGSMEFACKVAGSKLIVVLGHTNCSAIASACNNFSLGHFTNLIEKIKPAIEQETITLENRNDSNIPFVDNVTGNNVHITVDKIRQQSEILLDMEKKDQIMIVGALYNVETGQVTFYE
ncbi:MAG: carbonic anhydrase family protein [Bacteroidota bacterium]